MRCSTRQEEDAVIQRPYAKIVSSGSSFPKQRFHWAHVRRARNFVPLHKYDCRYYRFFQWGSVSCVTLRKCHRGQCRLVQAISGTVSPYLPTLLDPPQDLPHDAVHFAVHAGEVHSISIDRLQVTLHLPCAGEHADGPYHGLSIEPQHFGLVS